MATANALTPGEVARLVERAVESHLVRQRYAPAPHAHVYASACRECERQMVLELTQPDQQVPLPARAIGAMHRGRDRERDILIDLQKSGRDSDPPFEIIGQQERFEIRGRSGDVVIAGKVDARLRVQTISAPVEVKTWGFIDRIETFDDVIEDPYKKPGAFQLLSYMFGANQPIGFLVLDRAGIPKLVPVELDAVNLGRMEDFLSRAERVVEHRNRGTLPDYIDDPATCRRCGFYGATCNPPIVSKAAEVFIDPDLEQHLERWHTLRATGREWQSLDADIKRRFRGVESAIVGHFAISGKWGKQSRLDAPPEIKQQYTITDPKGRFTVEIERL